MERSYVELTELAENATFGGGKPVSKVLVPLDLIDLVREDVLGCKLFLANGQAITVHETFEEVKQCLA